MKTFLNNEYKVIMKGIKNIYNDKFLSDSFVEFCRFFFLKVIFFKFFL